MFDERSTRVQGSGFWTWGLRNALSECVFMLFEYYVLITFLTSPLPFMLRISWGGLLHYATRP